MSALFLLHRSSVIHLTVSLLVVVSTSAFAQNNVDDCDLRFAGINDIQWTASNGGYDPDDSTRYERFSLSVQNVGSVTCNWYVTVTAGLRGDSNFRRGAYKGNDFIEYNLLSTANISPSFTIKDYPNVTRAEQTISGVSIPPRGSAQIDFFMGVESNQRLSEGKYVDTVTFKLVKGEYNSPRVLLADVQTVTITIPVVPKLSLNIGTPTNGPHYLLDYGTLETGARRSVDMWISSTSQFSLWVSSQNRGILQHTQQAEATIPYTLSYNGNVIQLDRVFPSYLSLSENPAHWKHFLLNFEIENVSTNAKSGEYQDVLNIYVVDL